MSIGNHIYATTDPFPIGNGRWARFADHVESIKFVTERNQGSYDIHFRPEVVYGTLLDVLAAGHLVEVPAPEPKYDSPGLAKVALDWLDRKLGDDEEWQQVRSQLQGKQSE